MRNPLATLLAYIAPYNCIVCGTEDYLLCHVCRRLLPPALTVSVPGIVTVQAVTSYTEPVVKQLLWRLKSDRAAAAACEIAAMLTPLLAALPPATVITYTPTAASRIRTRGYDQAQLIACHASRASGLPFQSLLVRRPTYSRQVGSSRMKRKEQAAHMFTARTLVNLPANVCIIDDVITTGATLGAAADVLSKAGVQKVFAVVFAAA